MYNRSVSLSKMLSDSEDWNLFKHSALQVISVRGVRSSALHLLNKECHKLGEDHHLFPQLKKYPNLLVHIGSRFRIERKTDSRFIFLID